VIVVGISHILTINNLPGGRAGHPWSNVLENALDRERDQLPLWLPVGIGVGVAIWQFYGTSAISRLLLLALAVGLFALSAKPHSRIRQFLGIAAVSMLLGFALISLKSAAVDQPLLGKVWIGEFYGRIEAVENITAREVVRLRLATNVDAGLPPVVRVNLTPEQYQSTFQTGAVIRLRARLMPPAGPTLPGGYDFARRAWFQKIGATGSALGRVTLIEPAKSNAMLSAKRAQLTQHIFTSMPAQLARRL
jgi:competence protein ComEC